MADQGKLEKMLILAFADSKKQKTEGLARLMIHLKH